jgi:predicted nuclease of predicted toxin-antitoxin system
MKLLFDQNLSYKLVSRLSDIFPESSHIKIHNLSKEEDVKIREFAKENDLTIVTQDSDFYELALLYGIPPKIIWIRSGNSSTNFIEMIIRSNATSILHFKSDDKVCLELF